MMRNRLHVPLLQRFRRMLKTRIIPTLLWDAHGLCKPVAFVRPGRRVGSLMSAALLYDQRGCDELILLDIDATPTGRGPRFEEIRQFTSKLFCPLAVGGDRKSTRLNSSHTV